MRKLTRRSAAVALTAVVGLSAAGAAWAAWNLTGSGTAEAKAGSVVNLEVTSAGLADGAALTPGNLTSVKLNVKNENKFPVKITNIDLTAFKSDLGGCVGDKNVTILNDADLPSDADVTVPAAPANGGASTREIVWTGPLRMNNDAADACQKAGFSFNVHLDAISAAS
jgi:hypothetical protein